MEIQHTENQTAALMTQQKPLTAEQKEKLQEILSNYKPENFSKQDQISLRQDLKNAGIPKSMEVGKIIKETGFSSPQSSRNSRIPDYMSHQNDQLITPRILALFKQHGAGELTEEEFHSQLEQVKQNYSKSSGNLVNKSI